MIKNNQQEAKRYWQEKEKEIGEEIIGKEMCEYLSGYDDLEPRTWGLLYYSETSFYFQVFPKKSFWSSLLGSSQDENRGETRLFQIPWSSIKEIQLPTRKKSVFSIFSLPDYRVLIKYEGDNKERILVLLIYTQTTQEKFLECFQKYSH